MKLSIITICYNEPNLEKTCKSIVGQTFQDFEWIVVDGGSNEKTQKIWDKYKYRIDKFISEPDNGIYNAMNKGIRLACGEYLNFLNAGDYYDNDRVLEDIMNYDFDSEIVSADMKILRKSNKIKKFVSPEKVEDSFLINSSLPHSSSFIKRYLFEQYGLYNENFKIVSDYEKWVQFIKTHECSYKHIPVLCSVFNSVGISSQNNVLRRKERLEVIRKYFTDAEILKAEVKCYLYMNLTFGETLFSIKNSTNGNYKFITFLGFHVKIKLKRDDNEESINNRDNRSRR